jgi:arylsulfatase A-like enzyme
LVERQVTGWPNEVLVHISESMTGRALRTAEWAYIVAHPDGKSEASSLEYREYQLYNLYSDPHQLLNLAGRVETRQISNVLRERLLKRILDAGEETPQIRPEPLYP